MLHGRVCSNADTHVQWIRYGRCHGSVHSGTSVAGGRQQGKAPVGWNGSHTLCWSIQLLVVIICDFCVGIINQGVDGSSDELYCGVLSVFEPSGCASSLGVIASTNSCCRFFFGLYSSSALFQSVATASVMTGKTPAGRGVARSAASPAILFSSHVSFNTLVARNPREIQRAFSPSASVWCAVPLFELDSEQCFNDGNQLCVVAFCIFWRQIWDRHGYIDSVWLAAGWQSLIQKEHPFFDPSV